MANEILDGADAARVKSLSTAPKEFMVCQMRALIRELWPDEFGAKPKLTLMQGGLSS